MYCDFHSLMHSVIAKCKGPGCIPVWQRALACSTALVLLESLTPPERAALPVMAPGRADVIVAGATILVEVLARFGFEEALVSETDILDGLALELIEGSVT